MTAPEAQDYLKRAKRTLIEARAMLTAMLPEAAGRSAYFAAYHSAQALIFDRTEKIAKTHSGVRSEFARLAKDDPRIDQGFPTFLARAYNLKTAADYGIGAAETLSTPEAEQAIAIAEQFIEGIAAVVGR